MISRGRRHRKIKVSVVIPAYNEEGNIEPLMREFDRVLRACSFSYEIILVNDGSTDRTEQKMVEALRRYGNIRLVNNRVRMGLTRSLSRGFEHTSGEILVFYPADLQFHPRDIPRMIDSIDNGADMVCGRKVGAYGKWLVSKVYNMMTRILFPNLKVRDMNSVKAFTRQVYEDFPTLREGWHRYLAAFAAARDYIVREVPVTLEKRTWGKSKFSGSSRILKGLTDLIAVKFQVSVLGDPMHLFGRIALLFFVLGLIAAGIAFYFRFVEQQGFRPLLYAVIFFELSALVTFVMGIITEALVYLRDSLTELKIQNARLTEEVKYFSTSLQRGKSVSKPESVDEDSSKERPVRKDDRRAGSGDRQPRQRRSSRGQSRTGGYERRPGGRSGDQGTSDSGSSDQGSSGRRESSRRESSRRDDSKNDNRNDSSSARSRDRTSERGSDRPDDTQRGSNREQSNKPSQGSPAQSQPQSPSQSNQQDRQGRSDGGNTERGGDIKLRELPTNTGQEKSEESKG